MAKRILVVDDQLNVRNILKFNLERKGYEVITASDGETAVKVALTQNVNLILLDIMLPDLDGYKIMDILKTKGVMDRTPIIIISAKGEETDILTALKKGARDYIVKPFNFEVLFNKISRIIHSTFNGKNDPEEKEEKTKPPIITLGRNLKAFTLIQIKDEFEEEDSINLEENLVPLVQSGWTNIFVDFKQGTKVKTISLGKLVKIQQEIERNGGTISLIIRDADIETHIKEANFAKYFTIFETFEDAFSNMKKEIAV